MYNEMTGQQHLQPNDWSAAFTTKWLVNKFNREVTGQQYLQEVTGQQHLQEVTAQHH